MKSRQTGPRTAPRGLLFSLLAVLLVITLWIPQTKAADVSDMSMYERASEVTRQFSSALAPGADAEALNLANAGEDGVKLTAGNAGGLLGYAEVMEDDVGVIGWLMNSYTNASATISYDQLENVVPSSSTVDAGKANPFFQYAGYGEALTEMGLVSTVRPGSASSMAAPLFTGIVVMVYLLANAAPFLFQSALFLLSALNPFKLFMSVIEGTGNMELGILSEVADYVGGIYLVVQELSITILFPMLLALTVVSVLMFRSSSAMKKFSRYALRVFMLFAGLPLIGATYTGVVEGLDSEVKTGADYANYLVLSSYVDFEGWVRETRLAPPGDVSGLAIKNPRTATDESSERMRLSDRALVLNINGNRAGSDVALEMSDRYEATSDISEIFSTGGDTVNVEDQGYVDAQTKGSFSETFDLLTRHMTRTLYTGSQYDGEVSGQIQKLRSAANNETDGPIIQMFSLTSSDSRSWGEKIGFGDEYSEYGKAIAWKDATGLFTPGAADNEDFQFGTYAYNIYNAGSLTTNGSAYFAPGVRTDSADGLVPIGTQATHVVGGLSPLAMYNFLNTTFTDSGLTVYSPKKTASDISRDSYTSVSFAGFGVSKWVRYMENVVVMLSLASLSIAYGAMMLSAAIKNIPRILTSVFGTALGSIAFATKLMISTAVMIIQVIGMIFLYTLSENIIMTLLLNFNSVTSSVSSYFGAGTVALEFTRGLLVIGVTAVVTFFLIKNMNVFREMMEEVVTNSITRVMGALDTTTGGEGMTAAKTSGGRVGADGKMTDGARAADAKGIGGLTNAFAGGGLLGGAAGLIGAAHDVEARREQAEQEKDGGVALNPDGSVKTTKDKLANRYKTAKDLVGARMKDAGKAGVGIEGKSLAREMQAKDQSISAIALREAITPKQPDSGEDPDTGANVNSKGQALDENGNVKRDEHGNALNAKGQPISSNAPMGVATNFTGMGADGMAAVTTQAMTDSEGRMLDADGQAYTDENGNAFRQDSKGRLIDENGQHVALDRDGVLKPLAEVPNANGKPVSALREAAKLDGMRFDADKFAGMQNAQDASHYGLGQDGQVVDADGKAMMARTATGISPVTMDAAGFITDKDGNKVKASDMVGAVDPRGFEAEIDPETGENVMRHKGDMAMKPLAAAATVGAVAGAKNKKQPKSLTALANQSNKANALAQRADARVSELRANGASPYAINQAERFANKAKKNAQAVQNQYNGALKQAGTSVEPAMRREPVSQAHVDGAVRHAQSAQSAFKAEESKLNAMEAAGAPAKDRARQAQRVVESLTEAQRAESVAQDTKTAQATGRSFGEVSQARHTADRAEKLFTNKQQALDAAVQQGAAPAVIQQREQAMQKASSAFAKARGNMERVSKAPSGTQQQIDQATAQHTQAQQQHAQAQSRLQQLEQQGSPAAVQAAKAEEQRSGQVVQQSRREIKQAEQRVQELEQTQAPRSQVIAAKRDVERATTKAQQAQRSHSQAKQHVSHISASKPSPQELNDAKRAEQKARRTVQQAAKSRKAVTSPAGWNEQAVPTIQPVPKASATTSFASLSADGINSYGDYQQRVREQSASVKSTQSQVLQAKQRLAAMRSSNRPPQVIRQAQQDVQALTAQAKTEQNQLSTLQDHAHGLLKNSRFQPMVANRPIRKNGAMVVNQLVNLGNTQAMLDNLTHQERTGALSDAGKRQLSALTNKVGRMKRDLVSTGIREDALRDGPSILQSTQQMQQSWDSFVNGTSDEQAD